MICLSESTAATRREICNFDSIVRAFAPNYPRFIIVSVDKDLPVWNFYVSGMSRLYHWSISSGRARAGLKKRPVCDTFLGNDGAYDRRGCIVNGTMGRAAFVTMTRGCECVLKPRVTPVVVVVTPPRTNSLLMQRDSSKRETSYER